MPFTSVALENLAILMGQVLPLAGAGHVDCLKPVSTALKSLYLRVDLNNVTVNVFVPFVLYLVVSA